MSIDEDYILLDKPQEEDKPQEDKPCKEDISGVSSLLYQIYKGVVLIGDISHIYGVLYFLFHLYRNPATYAVISTIGHGPFLVVYITLLKIRGLI